MRKLPIADPCHENWDAMRPEGARRFCETCQKHVHDLSSMTPRQAEQLVADERRRLCIRYLHDGADIVHLAPAPDDGARQIQWSGGIAAGLVAGVLASCTPHGKPEVETYAWEEPTVAASVHDGMVIPEEQAIADEPCGLTEPQTEQDPARHAPIKGMRKLMGKPAPRVELEEVVGDGL